MADTKRRTLDVEEAAILLGIGRTAAYRAAGSGQLPSLRIGGRLLILREPLERLLRGEPVVREPSDRDRPNAA